MDQVSSFIDESFAAGGMMTILGAFIRALLVMGLALTPRRQRQVLSYRVPFMATSVCGRIMHRLHRGPAPELRE